jgi:hypothetical protein
MWGQSKGSWITGQWWRLVGVAGIAWIVLFGFGVFVLQGNSPGDGDSIATIRQYFADNATKYTVADFMIAIGFVFFFLAFAVGLRWVLGPVEKDPPIFSWLTTIGALAAAIMGGLSGVPFGAMAVAAKNHYQLDDSTVRALVLMDGYGFNLLSFMAALFVGSASAVMMRAGGRWLWLGALGLVAALLMVTGASWPISGDDMGAIAVLGRVGGMGLVLWVLSTSIVLITRERPPFVEGVMARDGSASEGAMRSAGATAR